MPTRVTCTDTDTGDSESVVITDDVLVIVDGVCQVGSVQDYPKSGTQVWTIRNRKGLGR